MKQINNLKRDIETLELLEELLANYQGTLLIVSHDRTFLDNVVTSTLVFEGNGKIQEYIGGYQDWLRQTKPTVAQTPTTSAKATKDNANKDKPKQPKKLSYKDQKEAEELPKKIETLEKEQSDLLQITTSADFYQQPQEKITIAMDKLKKLEQDLEVAYRRWEELG